MAANFTIPERLFLSLFSTIFLAVLGSLTYLTVTETQDSLLVLGQMERVPARILSNRVAMETDEKSPFRPEITYSYEYRGKEYQSHRIWPNSRISSPVFASREEAEFAVSDIVGQADLKAYVNRNHPERSYLQAVPSTPIFALIALTVVLWLVFPILAFTLLRRYPDTVPLDKTKRALLRPLSHINMAPYWAHIPTLSAGLILSITFVAGTGWMLYRTVYLPFEWSERATEWKTGACKIVESHIIPDPEGSTQEKILVEYQYAFGGISHRGSRYDFYKSTMPSRLARNIHKGLLDNRGSEVPCYINPTKPSESVLVRSWKYPAWQELLVLVIAFAFSLVFGLTFLTLFINRISRRSRTRFDKVSETEKTRTQVDNITTRRRFKAVLGITLSFFLTGMTYLWLDGFWDTHFVWQVSLFFTMLALPLLIVTSIVYLKTWTALKHLSAPTPKLIFPNKEVRPGESLEIRWELDSPPEQVDTMTFQLRANEVATSGIGEDTDTFIQQIYKTEEKISHDKVGKGTIRLTVPLKAPPSFDGKHNRIHWEIGLEMVLKDNESLSEFFDVTILPLEKLDAANR